MGTLAIEFYIQKDFFQFLLIYSSSVILIIVESILYGMILYLGCFKQLPVGWHIFICHPVPVDIRFEDGLMLIILLVE